VVKFNQLKRQGYVVFNNLSLMFNSVSFYQIMKILCTPLIIFIQAQYYDIHTDTRTKLSLLPVCVGIFISVITDMEINIIGTVFAILATLSNTLYTIVTF
jgi:solute carrier family 35, member E3